MIPQPNSYLIKAKQDDLMRQAGKTRLALQLPPAPPNIFQRVLVRLGESFILRGEELQAHQLVAHIPRPQTW